MGGGAWKNFPALMDLYRRFPHHKWVFFSDDDTFIFVKTLLRRPKQPPKPPKLHIRLYWIKSLKLRPIKLLSPPL